MKISQSRYAFQVAWLAMAIGLSACASVRHVPAHLDLLEAQARPALRSLAQAASIDLDTGYGRVLKAGSRWQRIGAIAEGDVYRPVGDVFTLEGAHIHEAYLVVQDDMLVGFYLPAERGFSAMRSRLSLHFTR